MPAPPAPQSEEVAEALAKHSGRGLRALLVRPRRAPAPARLLRAAPVRVAGPPARWVVAPRTYSYAPSLRRSAARR
jgi:hypothetical protein